VVGFGGVLRWVLPSTGRAQTYRVLDSLIDTEVITSYAWRDVEVIPTRTLPPGALVLALTPLADDRALAALAALRARGFDLAVVDVSATGRTPAGAGEMGELAHRLWVLRHEGLRARYPRLRAAGVVWGGPGAPLPAAGGAGRGWGRPGAALRLAGPASGGAAIRPNRAQLIVLAVAL